MYHRNLVGQRGRLSLVCLPGFGVQHHPQAKGWGGAVAVVYQTNIILTDKPVQQQPGLECLQLVLGNLDCCWCTDPFATQHSPYWRWLDLVSDVELVSPRLLLLGEMARQTLKEIKVIIILHAL